MGLHGIISRGIITKILGEPFGSFFLFRRWINYQCECICGGGPSFDMCQWPYFQKLDRVNKQRQYISLSMYHAIYFFCSFVDPNNRFFGHTEKTWNKLVFPRHFLLERYVCLDRRMTTRLSRLPSRGKMSRRRFAMTGIAACILICHRARPDRDISYAPAKGKQWKPILLKKQPYLKDSLFHTFGFRVFFR